MQILNDNNAISPIVIWTVVSIMHVSDVTCKRRANVLATKTKRRASVLGPFAFATARRGARGAELRQAATVAGGCLRCTVGMRKSSPAPPWQPAEPSVLEGGGTKAGAFLSVHLLIIPVLFVAVAD